MKLDQLYYTSCRRGLTSGPGFQTRAMSPGLSMEDRREIEAKSVYRLPRDIDLAAFDSLADERLPVTYRVYRLANGRFALTRSACAGQDYTGRGGNFHAHTIVLEGEPPAGLWPFGFLHWPGWLPRLAPEEDGMEPPPPLPVRELSDGELAQAWLEAKNLPPFLKGTADAARRFKEMLAALLQSRVDGRLLLIKDTPTNNVLWLACLQFALPAALAWRLTWSTYQDDPRGAGRISATCGQTGYRLDKNARDFQYYLFDFSAGQFSTVAEGSDYADVVTTWLLDESDTLEAFHRFAAWFGGDVVQDRLPGVLMLFRMVRGESGWSADDWRMAAELAKEHLDHKARVGMLQQFLAQAEKVPENAIVAWFHLYVNLARGGNAPLRLPDEGVLKRLAAQMEPVSLGRQIAHLADGQEHCLPAMARSLRSIYYGTLSHDQAASRARRFGHGLLERLPLSPEALAIRGQLAADACHDLLLGEWDSRIAAANEPLRIWNEYRDGALRHLGPFFQAHGAQMAEDVWRAITARKNAPEMALEWCVIDDLDMVSGASREEILRLAFMNMPFDWTRDAGSKERRIQDLAARWNVGLPNYRNTLRVFWRSCRMGIDSANTVRYQEAVRHLSNQQYASFLEKYFKIILCPDPRSDADAMLWKLKAVFDPSREAVWAYALRARLKQLVLEKPDGQFRAWLLDLWVNKLADFLLPATRQRILPVMARFYRNDMAGLLDKHDPGEFLDELRRTCERARPGNFVSSLVDSFRGFIRPKSWGRIEKKGNGADGKSGR
jgi:hypothetical protein